jgi:hypothetical protein
MTKIQKQVTRDLHCEKQKISNNKKRPAKQNRKSDSASSHNSRQSQKIIRFTPVSAGVIFKTTIIIMDLIVAAMAMERGITEAVVWAFLTMVASYAALSNPQSLESKKK